jgi:HEAT repeat protein
MPVSRDDVVRALLPDEPHYAATAQRLGNEAAPVLAELAASEDLELASKATSLAGFMDDESARQVLVPAAHHESPVVRVAAAAALEHHPDVAGDLAASLLRDPDVGVRKWTLRSLAAARPSNLKEQVQVVASDDTIPALRELARQVIDQLP